MKSMHRAEATESVLLRIICLTWIWYWKSCLFNFNQKKEVGMKTITVGDKTVIEAVV